MKTSTTGVDANRFSFECKSGDAVEAGSRDEVLTVLRRAQAGVSKISPNWRPQQQELMLMTQKRKYGWAGLIFQ